MYVMELESDLLKRVLKYWNLKHEDFPLLQDRDSLSEIMSGYWYNDTLYYDCLKKVENPKLLVSDKAFKAFVERFIERLNTILVQVVMDIRKELADSENKQCKIITEKMMICAKDVYSLTDADNWTLVQLDFSLSFVQSRIANLRAILSWFDNGRQPHFAFQCVEGTRLIMKLTY